MNVLEQALGRMVTANNRRIHSIDAGQPNPRPLDGLSWHDRLVTAYPAIRDEWDRFESGGGRLPLIEDLIAEHQGNQGAWRAGLLISKGRPVALAPEFPATVDALLTVPGMRSALWSYMDPGTELPEHTGPNAGMLRYHLGVRCPEGAALQVSVVVVPYRDGQGVLFDDTAPHAAWNRGTERRVTLFCEIERPLPRTAALANRGVQAIISLDSRYREAPRRAAEWQAALDRRSLR